MKRASASRSEIPSASSSEEDEPQNHPPAEESEEEEVEEDGVAEQRKQPALKPEKKLRSSPSKSKSGFATLKRHVEAEPSGNSSKRAKKNVSAEAVDSIAKKSAIYRFWSEDDEIAILQGIIDYVREKGVTPARDFDYFCYFMRKLLGISIKKPQLSDKISRLKKRYKNNLEKTRKFSNPHDEKLYDLSCKIWGDEGVLTDVAKSSGTVRKNQREGKDILVDKELLLPSPVKTKAGLHATGMSGINEMIALHKLMAGEKLDEGFIKEGLTLLDAEQRMKFERRWKQLQLEEWELHMKRIGLVHEEAHCISEAVKSKLD